jgi:hypothetical protein
MFRSKDLTSYGWLIYLDLASVPAIRIADFFPTKRADAIVVF